MENIVSENKIEESQSSTAQRDGSRRFGGLLVKEVKLIGYIAGPMIIVNLSQYFLQIISIMMVGHLGKLYLSSTAVAISFGVVTGFSVLYGMAGALETLSGQAYGAQQYRKLGIQTNTAIFSLILVCLPLCLMWAYMGKILVLLGQDPVISREAGRFMLWFTPALFAYATLQALVRYFQTQSMTIPLVVSSCISFCCHIPLCWVLVFKSRLENLGGALSIGISYWLNVILLVLYMIYSPTCESTRVPISTDIFQGIREFLRFAIPSAMMVCFQWWSSQVLTLLSGFLPNPQLETSMFSLCLSTVATIYAIPEGLGAAGSTRVSNELGAGNPRAARLACGAVMILTVFEAVIISSVLLACRSVFGHIFSNEKDVVDYAAKMAPLVSLAIFFRSFTAVLSGIATGCGFQKLGAFVNLGSYYFLSIPIAAILAFRFDLRGKGLWIGFVAGAFSQAFVFSLITLRINWDKKARLARERIFNERSQGDIGLTE